MKNLLFIPLMIVSSVIFAQKKTTQKANIENIISKTNTKIENVKIDILTNGNVTSSKEFEMNKIQVPKKQYFNVRYSQTPELLSDYEVPISLKNNDNLVNEQLPNEYYRLPEIIFGKVKNSTEVISYQVYLVSKSTFKFNHQEELFHGDVKFILIDVNDESNSRELEQPVHIEIDQGEVDQIQPNKLSLSKLSFPPSRIELSEENGLDSLQIKILTASNLSGYPVTLKVEPALRVTSLTKNVNAFGMEKAKLNVSIIGSSSIDSIQVNLDTNNGNITPETFILKNNELKTVYLQSGNNLGETQVMATARGANAVVYNSNLVMLNYVFPWIFLGLAFIGGLIGSIVRSRKNTNFLNLVLGMLDGFIACILYFFLKIPIPKLGELDYIGVVIFGIAFLGGFATITRLFPYLRSLLPGQGQGE